MRHCAGVYTLKTLHKYLTGQVLATLALTVAVFTAVLLVGNALREILLLLASTHISPLLVGKAFLYLIPFVWVFALPMGMLTATLLVFGRFSADQELTAARASGVSLLSLSAPVLLVSLLGCSLSAWFNLQLGPQCRVAYLKLIDDVKAEVVKSAAFPEGRFIKDFKNYIIYVDKNDSGKLQKIMIWKLENETNTVATIYAPAGQILTVATGKLPMLRLLDPRIFHVGANGAPVINAVSQWDLDMNELQAGPTNVIRDWKPKISDMTFLQLRQELHDLEQLRLNPSPPAVANAPADSNTQWSSLRNQQKDFIEPVRVAMHREFALSFACFGFTLIGIPLAIRVHRRETNIGIAVALVLVVVYFAFVNLGASLAARPEFYPHLILWVPNFIFQAVGAALLWRANKGV
jgi:lipopolysaccharide export system permease protein